MRLMTNRLLALASMAFMGIFAMLALPTTAQAQSVFCSPWAAPGGTGYPSAGNHAFVCGSTSLPTQAHQDELYNGLVTKLATKSNVVSLLNAQNVRYYFFRNAQEADSFFQNTPPYAGHNAYRIPSNTGRCAYTAFDPGTPPFQVNEITVAIFETCRTVNTQQINPTQTFPNPGLERVGLHESGHAYAFAFKRQLSSNPYPDRKGGFSRYHVYDRQHVNPPNWSTWNPSQRDQFVCGMFGNLANSTLEIDLGANKTLLGAVCTGNVRNASYGGNITPFQIANGSNFWKVPGYFVSQGDYIEAWAEEFAIVLSGSRTSPAALLPITDMFLGYNPPAIGGVAQTRTFNCTRFVVETYVNQGRKPNATEISNAGCPAETDL